MTKDQALDLAQEALEDLARYADTCELFLKETHPGKADALRERVTNSIQAITAIKQARSAPVQEPVAWQAMGEDEALKEFPIRDMAHDWCVQQKLAGSAYSYWIRPLYTTPPAAQRQWVGLTDDDRVQFVYHIRGIPPYCVESLDGEVRAIEAKLKEKNT